MKLSSSLTLTAILTTAACEQNAIPADQHLTLKTDAATTSRQTTANIRETVAECAADRRLLLMQQNNLDATNRRINRFCPLGDARRAEYNTLVTSCFGADCQARINHAMDDLEAFSELCVLLQAQRRSIEQIITPIRTRVSSCSN